MKVRKFKVGDKVICVDDTPVSLFGINSLRYGVTYMVAGVTEDKGGAFLELYSVEKLGTKWASFRFIEHSRLAKEIFSKRDSKKSS